jgi:hypothetical protein
MIAAAGLGPRAPTRVPDPGSRISDLCSAVMFLLRAKGFAIAHVHLHVHMPDAFCFMDVALFPVVAIPRLCALTFRPAAAREGRRSCLLDHDRILADNPKFRNYTSLPGVTPVTVWRSLP